MRYIFKLFIALLFTFKIFARDIILIDQIGEKTFESTLAFNVLTQKFNFPPGLINSRFGLIICQRSKEALLQLCITKEHEIEIFKLDEYLFYRTFNEFLYKEER